MDRTLKKGMNSWCTEAHVKFEKRRSHVASKGSVNWSWSQEKMKKVKKGGKLQMMRRVADETNLESLFLPCQLLQQYMPSFPGFTRLKPSTRDPQLFCG